MPTVVISKVVSRKLEVAYRLAGRHHLLGDVYAVKIATTATTSVDGVAEPPESSTTQALCDTEGLQLVLKGHRPPLGPFAPHPEISDNANGVIQAVRPAFVEDYAKYGSMPFVKDEPDDQGKAKRKEKNVEELYKVRDPYDALERGEDLLLVEGCRYVGEVFDMEGVPYSQPIHIDYIEGSFSNEMYDLKLAVEILSEDPRVELLKAWGKVIQDVPGYNSTKSCTEFVSFNLRLPRDQYVEYHKHKDKGESLLYKSSWIFKTDLLGLISGGAARYADGAPWPDNANPNPLFKGEPLVVRDDDDEGDCDPYDY